MAQRCIQGKTVLVLMLVMALVTLLPAAGAADTYQFVRTWGSNGTGNGQFMGPTGITVDSVGFVYISDYWLNRIQKFDPRGNYMSTWGVNARDNPSPPTGQFSSAFAVHKDTSGNFYVIDSGAGTTSRIQKFSPEGNSLAAWGKYGAGPGELNSPWDLATDSKGNLYVTESGNSRVQKFSPEGTYITSWGSAGTGDSQFNRPLGIAIGPSDTVYVADAGNNRIQKFSSTGTFLGKFGSYGTGNGQLHDPAGLAIDTAGNLFVVDALNYRVQKFSANDTFLTAWGSKGTTAGQFIGPFKIGVDTHGGVYVIDWDTYGVDNPPGFIKGTGVTRIQKFEPATTTATTPTTPIPLPPPSLTLPVLNVFSTPPGADVFIDGEQRGTTPLSFVEISPGEHLVIVSMIGYLGDSSTVWLQMGKTTTVDTTLKPLTEGTGIIAVESDPAGASIVLDGVNAGVVTPYTFYSITPGLHTLEVTMAGYGTYLKTVTVDPGTTVTVTTPWSYGDPDTVVMVNTKPDGANLFIDDAIQGTTPASIHLKKGTYIMKLTKEGYKDDESALFITSSDPVTVTRTLEAPGFGIILALAALCAVAFAVRSRR